jgi:hypothetical protein
MAIWRRTARRTGDMGPSVQKSLICELHTLIPELQMPYLRVYKLHFFDNKLPFKIGVWLMHGMSF